MPTGGQARKRRAYAVRVPPEQRRGQLLDAALHVVVTQGHSAVTMEAVAEQAGVTKPVVYGMFPNRKVLLAALLQREQEEGLQQLRAILPGQLDQQIIDDPSDLLARMCAEFLRVVRESPDRWHCIVIPMPDMPAEFHAAREQARADALERAEALVRSVLDMIGAPSELDPEIAAHAIVTLCEMAARLVLTDPNHFHPDRFVAAIRAVIGPSQLR